MCAAPLEAASFPPGSPGEDAGRLSCVGVGKTAAALGLTRALMTSPRPRLIVNFGVCGAYPGSGLSVGDGCIVTRETFVDEGVETATGFLDLRSLGFDQTASLLADEERSLAWANLLGVPRVLGATVSCCSGTDALAGVYAGRSGAAVETMEGAAVAHVAQAFDIPWVGVRAVSNRCGERAQGGWDLPRALQRLQSMLAMLVGACGPAAGD